MVVGEWNFLGKCVQAQTTLLSKSAQPGELDFLMRLRVKSTPQGCAWILIDRTLLMILGMSERPGRSILQAQREMAGP